MDTARQTDERLRHALNADQPSRERLCTALLALDRNFSDIRPRRPEGGPDGGRDIECLRGPNVCFGAVGFVNNASDSPKDKKDIKKKFKSDLLSAIQQNKDLKAFVFFTNIDLTPSEVSELKHFAEAQGISFTDIYWRDRIRQALDGTEGLAIRYQYLGISLSEAEQASFFSRFGKDLESLLTGKFERLEQKIDFIEYLRWQTGMIRMVTFDVLFNEPEKSEKNEYEHFRVCLELQGLAHEKRNIIIGGQDDYWKSNNDMWFFGTKTFFFRERVGKIDESWLPQHTRVGGGYVDGLHIGVKWFPVSNILAAEFENLNFNFHFTENLRGRIAKVKFAIDSYIFMDTEVEKYMESYSDYTHPSLGWPSVLTNEQNDIKWRACSLGRIQFNKLPKIKENSDLYS